MKNWWKEGVVYQVYTRSYSDSNGDGIGDLKGLISRLDYISDLGVKMLWLNPVYESPNDDNGYDISNYRSIMKEFGTLSDWEELLDGLHKRGIKLIMDLVVNHTSDEHRWFLESKKSKDNEYSDYYIWKDPIIDENGNKTTPNNWTSFFSGSTWEYVEERDQYYLHLFTKKQPDLNWENQKVKEEVYDLMKFWFDKGIDGFRMDVINLIDKKEGYPNGIEKGLMIGIENYATQPKFHTYMRELNDNILSKYDCMTVGETPTVTIEDGLDITHPDRKELNMIFQFEHMDIDKKDNKWNNIPWELKKYKENIRRWNTVIEKGGWNSNYLMNHDQPRALSRFGNDKEYRKESAKLLATLTITLPGTPYVYQGEEIGMTNVKFNNIEEVKDVESINWYNQEIKKGVDNDFLIEKINISGRDHSRTPMQWSDTENAGFTSGKPWIKINENYNEINVQKEQEDEDSVLNYYRKLIELRNNKEVLSYGDFEEIYNESDEIFGYYRNYNGEKILVLMNFSDKKIDVDVEKGRILLSNYKKQEFDNVLNPWEAVIIEL